MDGNKLALDYSLWISSIFRITCIAFAQLLPRCTALFHMIINPFDWYDATDCILSTMVNIPWLETPPVHYPKIYTFWHRNIIASLQENFDTNDYVWPKWLWCSRKIFSTWREGFHMKDVCSHWIKGLTHWGRDQIDAISQTTFSNAFSRMKMNEFRLEFHWSLFLRVQLTIIQHWFR